MSHRFIRYIAYGACAASLLSCQLVRDFQSTGRIRDAIVSELSASQPAVMVTHRDGKKIIEVNVRIPQDQSPDDVGRRIQAIVHANILNVDEIVVRTQL